MNTINVNTKSKNYPAIIGSDCFIQLPGFIEKNNLPKRVFVTVDSNVYRIYGYSIKKIINSFAIKKDYLVLTAAEKNKSIKTATQIFDRLHKKGFGIDTLMISIGGGTLGDISGFAASTYMRGINLIHIPTTLLASVDSSIGGKTGVNFNGTKNLIGTYYQPDLVLIDTNFLKTLPQAEMISGFGEVIKYSYLSDRKFYSSLLSGYSFLFRNDNKFLEEIIIDSVKIKSVVVSSDEKEKTGLRKILNFGHTFAHAFESSSHYKLSHGRAVIAGMIAALILSSQKNLIDKDQFDDMIKLPLKFKASAFMGKINLDEMINYMKHDKKVRDGKMKFVLLRNFGEIIVDVAVERKTIEKSLKEMQQVWFKRATAGL